MARLLRSQNGPAPEAGRGRTAGLRRQILRGSSEILRSGAAKPARRGLGAARPGAGAVGGRLRPHAGLDADVESRISHRGRVANSCSEGKAMTTIAPHSTSKPRRLAWLALLPVIASTGCQPAPS